MTTTTISTINSSNFLKIDENLIDQLIINLLPKINRKIKGTKVYRKLILTRQLKGEIIGFQTPRLSNAQIQNVVKTLVSFKGGTTAGPAASCSVSSAP